MPLLVGVIQWEGYCLETMAGNGNCRCGIFLFEIYTYSVVVISITTNRVTFWCCHSSVNCIFLRMSYDEIGSCHNNSRNLYCGLLDYGTV